MNKSKMIWGGIVIVALAFAGFLWYQSYARKGKALNGMTKAEEAAKNGTAESLEGSLENPDASGEALMEEDDTDYNAVCEKGEWVEIAPQSGALSSVTGKLRKVYPDDPSAEFKNYAYYIEGAENLGITGEKLFKLDYFEDREAEIQGVKNGAKKEIAIAKVKCAGAETDKNLIESRKKLMDYLATNINSIAPNKAKYKKWVVLTIDFIDESNVYVEYYDSIDDDENSDIEEDTTKKVLLETKSKAGGGYDTKVIAYWEMGEDDFVLKTGTDKFEDIDDFVSSYEFEPGAKTWERID